MRDEDVMEQFERMDKEQQEEMRTLLMVDGIHWMPTSRPKISPEWSRDYLIQ